MPRALESGYKQRRMEQGIHRRSVSALRALAWSSALAIAFVGCKRGQSAQPAATARRPHAPVHGPALWLVTIEHATLQALDDSDQPTGPVQTLSVLSSGEARCRLEADPGNEPLETWFAMRRQGGSGMSVGQSSAVPDDVTYCAKSSVINLPEVRRGPAAYRANVRVYFSEPSVQ